LAESFVEPDPDLALDVALSSGTEHVQLRVQAGRLDFVAPEDAGEPDLAIRFRALTLKEVLLGEAATCDVFGDAEIAVGDSWRPAAPAGESEVPRAGRFEYIPGASISISNLVTSTIFGEVGIHERWEDGALVSWELLSVSQLEQVTADIRIACSLSQLAAIRRRERTPLDDLADGVGVHGEWPQLMCLAELRQHPAYLPVWEADSTVEAQAAWGAIFSSPAYGNAALRAQPDPVVAP
jgi:hypothetical protein